MVSSGSVPASSQRVSINGKFFVLADDVTVRRIPAEGEAFRIQGSQRRLDNALVNKLVYPWNLGVGWSRMRRDPPIGAPRGVGGLRDSTMETRFSIAELAILHEAQTTGTQAGYPKKYVNFLGNHVGIFESDYASGSVNTTGAGIFAGASDAYVGTGVPVFNSHNSGSANSTSVTVSLTAQTTNGSTAIFAITAGATNGAGASGVTWNGNAMTKFNEITGAGGNITSWSIVGSDTGTRNCIATWSSSQVIHLSVMDFYNVDQTTPLDAGQTSEGTDQNTSLSNSVPSPSDIIIAGAMWAAAEASAPGGTQTELATLSTSSTALTTSWDRATSTSQAQRFDWASSVYFEALSAVVNGVGGIGYAVGDTVGMRVFDATVHKGALKVIGSAGKSVEQRYMTWSSPDGLVFTEPGNTSWPTGDLLTTTITRRNNFDDDEAKLLDFGNTIMAAIHDVGNSEVEIWYSTNAFANATAGAVIPSASGPKAFVRWKSPFSSPPVDSPVLVVSDGVYRVDSGGTTFDLIYSLDGSEETGRWAAVGLDGDLYVGLSGGDLIALHAEPTGGITVRKVGPPGDGFISARQGHINYILTPSLPWLFVSYGGHAASKNASIWAIEYIQRIDPDDGKAYQVWHHMYQEANANLDITVLGYSPSDDSIPRLHFAIEGTSVAELFHLERPDVSGAASGVTIKRQASGIMEFADDDNGDPHADTNILTGRLDADDLSSDTDGEYVEHEYGLNGAAWTNVSNFGNYVSGDKVLFFGKTQQNTSSTEAGTPVGVSAKRSRHRLSANRASTNTNTPKMREFQVETFSKANVITGFNVPIDIQATADMRGNTEVETIWNDIETIQDSVILLPFIFAEDGAGTAKTYYVRGDRASEGSAPLVHPASVGLGGTLDKTQRGGIYNLPLHEVIV